MSGGGSRSPQFTGLTAAQWQELEHQALIFKYLRAGLRVPPDLLAPIHQSLESMSTRFLQYPTMGYYSIYGKKIDPEPGRCRRSDGKKWRCSRDAHPDSKYCERHMNRGRNRSRKPVESQTASQSGPTPALNVGIGSSNGGRIFQNLPTSSNSVNLSFGSHSSQLQQVDTTPYGSCNKYSEPKPQAETSKALLQASVGVRGIIDMQSMVRIHNPTSGGPAELQLELGHSGPLNGFGGYSSSSSVQKQQHYLFGSEKLEQQPVQPLFDEWPEARTSRSFLDSQRSDMSSFSSTQLSMGIDRDLSPNGNERSSVLFG